MRYAAARAVSIVLHPAVVMVLTTAVSTGRHAPAAALRATLTVLGLTAIPAVAFTIRQVRQGRWENVDASRPEERPRLFVFALALMALLGIAVALTPRLAFLGRGVAVAAALFVVCWLLLRWIKVSLHVACASLAAAAMLTTAPAAGVTLALLTPILAWARITMQRHTFAEIALGALLGAAAGRVMVW